MSFKIHLIIVSVIIIAVYFTWQITQRSQKSQDTVNQEEIVSPYKISIISASYGLNCLESYVEPSDNSNDPFAHKNNKELIKRDNVLATISSLCNDKLKCSIPLSAKLLDNDPMPQCAGKTLDVEYRCFSFDRPWTLKGEGKSLDIDCSSAEARATQ